MQSDQILSFLDKLDRTTNSKMKMTPTYAHNYATNLSRDSRLRNRPNMSLLKSTTPMLTEGQRNYLRELFDSMVSKV